MALPRLSMQIGNRAGIAIHRWARLGMNETGHDRRRGPSKASVENGVRGGDARRRWMTLIGHDQRQDAERFRREHTSGSLEVCDYPGRPLGLPEPPFRNVPLARRRACSTLFAGIAVTGNR